MDDLGLNTKGPEGKNLMGEFAELEFKAFFSNFVGWKLLYTDVDLKGLKHPDDEKPENRGYDFLYKVREPFDNYNKAVIIESKKIESISGFSTSILSKHIEILKYKMDKANHSLELSNDQKIQHNEIKSYRYGILCYRFRKFDLNKYRNILKNYEPTESTSNDINFPVIFILSNDKLHAFSKWKTSSEGHLKFYDRDPLSMRLLTESDSLSLFNLFSDYIPFIEDDGKLGKQNGILTFDKPSVESFLYIEDFCKNFDLGISKIVFLNCDLGQKDLYDQYKEEVESFKKIEPLYLGPSGPSGMDCDSEDLDKVFK
jgi:hypothetical protein